MITVYLKSDNSQEVIYKGNKPEEKGIIVTGPNHTPKEFEIVHKTEVVKVKQINLTIGVPTGEKEVILVRV